MRRSPDAGFALPMTVFLIAIITLMLTAAFAKVDGDRRVAEASGATISAMAVAKSGLHQYLGTRPTTSPGTPTAPRRPADGDSVRINVASGYADVVAHVVRRPADTLANWLYVVRATGHLIDPAQGSDPQAVRTIAQFAQYQTGQMDVKAAYTAANGLDQVAAVGSPEVYVYGYDYCTVADPTGGARVPNGSEHIPLGSGYSQGTYWYVYGAPAEQYESYNAATLAANTNIDWNAILNGGFTPDFTSIQPGSGAYASQMVTGNATLTNDFGTGLLIVTGDLTFSGTWAYWYGIILVGGRVFFDATSYSYVEGMMISGLNAGTSSVSPTVIGSRTAYLYYDSCMINTALSRLTGFAPISNGWVDNWATY